MKTIYKLSLLPLLSYGIMQAQAYGNSNTSNISDSAVYRVNSVGSFAGINAIGSPTATMNLCSGNAVGFTAAGSNLNYSWSGSGTQNREYYNPYTGKYEASPTVGNDKASAALPYDNSVVFDADIMINVKASSYTAIFSMTDFGNSVFGADSALGARLRTFLNGLAKDSVKDEDVHVDFISMLPIYEVQPENKVFSNIATEKPAGFKIKKNVHVLFYDHRKLDKIITDAAKAGIYDLVKVDYNVSNIEAAYDTLRKVAVQVIDMKRNTYLKMGFTTTILMMAEGYDSKYPEERYASYTAYIQGSSAQHVSQQNPNVQIREADKEQTIFYNKVPYKQFDKVLNADMAEPGVQFYYKMRVKCKLEPVKSENEKPTTPATKPAAGTYKPPVHSQPQPARKP
jgi:uncharacterized protein YggE